ncbi:MAG: HAMP domain-containing sensor histidine kinase [Candidatus Nanopelagicaceae bacterium]
MKLRSRLTLASAIVTVVSTLVIGGLAINSTRDTEIGLLDKSLSQVVNSVQGDTNAALSEALYSAQQSEIALTLVYYLYGQPPSILNDSKLGITPYPTFYERKQGRTRPVTHNGEESYRMRTIDLSDREYLVVAVSLKEVDARYKSDLIRLSIFILLALISSIAITAYLVRRDTKKIEILISSAKEISHGNMDIDIPSIKGNSEVDQLAESLHRMVISLRRTAEIEELSSKRMQEFLGDASHELRTPLTVVRGYVELLSGRSMVDTEQRARAFGRVNSEIIRMESLINDLLFLAEFGHVPTEEILDVDLSRLLSSHLSDFATFNKNRVITSDIDDRMIIKGSESHMARLFANVFGNISRHTPVDAPVNVSLKRSDHGISLLIEDGGPGLPESAYREGIQNFQRFDYSRSRENGGSGLGMSIIFAIVREHRGTIILRPSALGGLGVHVFFGNLGA